MGASSSSSSDGNGAEASASNGNGNGKPAKPYRPRCVTCVSGLLVGLHAAAGYVPRTRLACCRGKLRSLGVADRPVCKGCCAYLLNTVVAACRLRCVEAHTASTHSARLPLHSPAPDRVLRCCCSASASRLLTPSHFATVCDTSTPLPPCLHTFTPLPPCVHIFTPHSREFTPLPSCAFTSPPCAQEVRAGAHHRRAHGAGLLGGGPRDDAAGDGPAHGG